MPTAINELLGKGTPEEIQEHILEELSALGIDGLHDQVQYERELQDVMTLEQANTLGLPLLLEYCRVFLDRSAEQGYGSRHWIEIAAITILRNTLARKLQQLPASEDFVDESPAANNEWDQAQEERHARLSSIR